MNANEKLFINALMSRKFIEESKAKELFRDLLTNRENDIENALPSQKEFDQFLGTREGQVTNEAGIGHKESALRARGREDIFGDLQRELQRDERIVREWITDDEITARNRSVSSGFGWNLRTEDTCRNGIDLERFIGQSQDAFMTQAQELSKNNNEEKKKE